MELALILGVVSAVVWALLAHVLVFRPLRHAPVLAQVVASVGLMLFLQALVQLRFDTENLFAQSILPETTVEIGGAVVNVSDLILAGVAIAVSLLLWAYFRLTTLGVATRAGSEDELAARLSGYSPRPSRRHRVGDHRRGNGSDRRARLVHHRADRHELHVLRHPPRARRRLVGRLTSFGIACAAGLVLGAFQSVISWLATKSWWPEWAQSGLGDAVPFVIVVVALFLLGGRIPSRGSLGEVRMPAVRIPRIRIIPTVAIIAAVVIAILLTSGTWRFGVVTSVILSLIALSLVLLTGYLGQISLASMAFAGAAGFALSKLTTNWNVPFPFSMLFAALIATGLGVLVGVPALRIRGAQLAVVTLAAALAIQSFVFNNPRHHGIRGAT